MKTRSYDLSDIIEAARSFKNKRDKREETQLDLYEKYPTVHFDDRAVLEYVKPNLSTGPWIAGGAPLQWYQNKPIGKHDVDVFFRDEPQFIAAQNYMLAQSNNLVQVRHLSDFAVTYEIRSGDYDDDLGQTTWSLQFIKHKFFTSAEDIFNHFDLSVCQIATDGKAFVLAEQTGADIKNRVLRFVSDYKADSLKRFVKYVSYGYKPVDNTVQAIIQNPKTRYDFDYSGEYSNAF